MQRDFALPETTSCIIIMDIYESRDLLYLVLRDIKSQRAKNSANYYKTHLRVPQSTDEVPNGAFIPSNIFKSNKLEEVLQHHIKPK